MTKSNIKIKRKRNEGHATKNFEAYLKLDKRGLEDKYVIIVNGEVVAKGEDIEDMLDMVKRKYPHETPFVAKIPDERMLILQPFRSNICASADSHPPHIEIPYGERRSINQLLSGWRV